MKALTICQPYPHLILTGEKPVENRRWPTRFRGPLLIHAGKSKDWLSEGDEARYPLVFGAIVGMADVIDCVHISAIQKRYPDLAGNEHVSGPYCFVLESPVRFERPIPYKGQQGFFEIPDHIIPKY